MSLPTIELPAVWDLPVVAGVPAVLGPISGTGLTASLSSIVGSEIDALLVEQAQAHWGIFTSANKRVLTAGSVVSLDYEAAYQICDAPIEDGAFVSYNKVKVPYTSRIMMVCDGTELGLSSLSATIKDIVGTVTGSSGATIRKDFLATLETICGDLNFYTIVTPEKSYARANIAGYRFRRSVEGGITMPVVEIALQEVRSGATTAYATTAQPEGQAAVQQGTVQASEITAAQNANLMASINAAVGAA